jgi:hypothetical protein
MILFVSRKEKNMEKEKNILIEDGLTVIQMRQLQEVTNMMAKAVNEEEFKAIMSIYGKATNRLLNGLD